MADQLLTTILIAAGLTDAELFHLDQKLSDWGHQFFLVGSALGSVAMDRVRQDEAVLGDQADTVMWQQRERYILAMEEMHELGAEIRQGRMVLAREVIARGEQIPA
jgi:hypothetical protein